MPTAAPKPCTVCRKLVQDGSARCLAHKVRPGSFADSRRGSRHQRGYGWEWEKLSASIKVRAKGLCEPCQAVGLIHEGHACDHIVSKEEWQRLHGSLAGADAPTNLQWICRDGHEQKTVIDRMRANGADVPPWRPSAPQPARPALFVESVRNADSAESGTTGGGEKSGGQSPRTVLLAKFSCAGNSTGGGTPGDSEGHS